MIAQSTAAALESVCLKYHRAKGEFEHFDKLSRTRALTDPESRAMERAMNRMVEWGDVS